MDPHQPPADRILFDIALGSDDRPAEETLDLIRLAEALGFANAWLTESRGRDVFVLLASAAGRTSRIGLGTGITNVYARTATTIAQAAGTIAELMPGRVFNLGLAASGRGLVELYHRVPFERPVARVRDAARIVDFILAEGRMPPAGPGERAGPRLTLTPMRDRVRIFIAGSSDATLRFIGAEADGWLPVWPSRRHTPEQVATIAEAARATGRPLPDVAGYLYGGLDTDPDVVAATRDTLAWYIAANGEAYRKLFLRYGYDREVGEIVARWEAGDHRAAAAAIPREMLDDCALMAAPAAFADQAKAFVEAGIARPVLRVVRELSADRVAELLTETAGLMRLGGGAPSS